ncbi:hypothetical protein OESDEN_18261 [Oesophagostomum dentatum]|uniref:Uncharacterized protein n=1 Tax=Oesophagostomum dentatum TaxID=61180 RepID=A0A0B1S9R7_OESDE|nr:hypothetical protein OESDEN_18261 [Oesophagostomum dentatum]
MHSLYLPDTKLPSTTAAGVAPQYAEPEGFLQKLRRPELLPWPRKLPEEEKNQIINDVQAKN